MSGVVVTVGLDVGVGGMGVLEGEGVWLGIGVVGINVD